MNIFTKQNSSEAGIKLLKKGIERFAVVFSYRRINSNYEAMKRALKYFERVWVCILCVHLQCLTKTFKNQNGKRKAGNMLLLLADRLDVG